MTTDIFKYLEGNDSPKEKDAFEKRMTSDAAFKEEVMLCQNINQFIEKKVQDEEINEFAKEIHYDFLKRQKKRKGVPTYSWYAVVAILIIALGIFGVWFEQNSIHRFYKSNYRAWQPGSINRGTSTEAKYSEWLEAYEHGDFEFAINEFKQLPLEQQTDAIVVLMYACAFIEADEFEQALNILNATSTAYSTMLTGEYNWYKGLCYLKLDDDLKAKNAFALLLTNNKYGTLASEILKKLD